MDSKLFHGIAASPGIGVGKIFLLEKEELIIVKKEIKKEDLKKEVLRFEKALNNTKKEIAENKEEMLKLLGKTHARLADAYLQIKKEDLKKEVLRFEKALNNTKKEIAENKEEMLKLLGKTHARLADAYLLILEDPIL